MVVESSCDHRPSKMLSSIVCHFAFAALIASIEPRVSGALKPWRSCYGISAGKMSDARAIKNLRANRAGEDRYQRLG